MNEGLIPRRYAKALFKVARERKVEMKLYELMTMLTRSFRLNPELTQVVNNPFQSVDDKLMLITTAAGATADDTIFADFLQLLVDNNRLGLIEHMAIAYCDIYRRENRIHLVNVTSAAELTPEAFERLRKLIADHLGGDSMEFSTSVDPELIGGFTVKVDNDRLDASILNQFKELRLNLLSKQK